MWLNISQLLTEPEQMKQLETTTQYSFKVEPSEEFTEFLKEQPEMGKNIKVILQKNSI